MSEKIFSGKTNGFFTFLLFSLHLYVKITLAGFCIGLQYFGWALYKVLVCFVFFCKFSSQKKLFCCLTFDTHNRHSQQTLTIDTYNRNLQQTLTIDTYNRHSQQTLTIDTHNRHLQQKRTIDTYNRHLQQILTIDTYNRHLQQVTF